MNYFDSKVRVGGELKERTAEEIENEPMVFSADALFAYKHGGPITREFLAYLDPDKDWIIDTRVHMLMEGWYPCIGGWHCDNIPRNTQNGQPNFQNPPFVCNHTLAVIDASDQPTGSLTEFLTDSIYLADPEDPESVYKCWSEVINEYREAGIIRSRCIPSGKLINFDARTFHRGQPATSKGWRFFIRAMTGTPQKPINKIRRQVNTYINVEAGW